MNFCAKPSINYRKIIKTKRIKRDNHPKKTSSDTTFLFQTEQRKNLENSDIQKCSKIQKEREKETSRVAKKKQRQPAMYIALQKKKNSRFHSMTPKKNVSHEFHPKTE